MNNQKKFITQLQEEVDNLFKSKNKEIKDWVDRIEDPPYRSFALSRAEPTFDTDHLKVIYECSRSDPLFNDFEKKALIPMAYLESEDPDTFIKDTLSAIKLSKRKEKLKDLEKELKSAEKGIKLAQNRKKEIQDRINNL